MNREAFDDHPLWATLGSLKELLEGDLSDEDDGHRSEIRMVHSVVQYLDSLQGIDPDLVDDETLTPVNNELVTARDHLSAYIADRESNEALLIGNVVPSVQSARNAAIRTFPAPPSDERERASQAALDRYRESADAEIIGLRGQIEELKARLTDLDNQRVSSAQTTEQSLAGLQERISEGEQTVATQTTQLQEQIETQRVDDA